MKDIYYNFGDDCRSIIDSISDWDEVSDKEYKILYSMSNRCGYNIIERPADAPAFIAKTVADYKKLAKIEAERAAAEKQQRDEAALKRKHKKELKDRESKLKLLKHLQEELGSEVEKI